MQIFTILAMMFLGCTSSSVQKSLSNSDNEMTCTTPIQNYVFFGRDRERISDKGFLDTKQLEGAQLTYTWKKLEPEEDVYEFGEIQRDLEFLSSKGKKLFIQLQDTTFSPKVAAVPNYLRKDPRYKGGVVYQYDSQGKPEGLVAMRWDKSVQERFHRLLKKMGKAFNGKIAGINLQEIAIEVDKPIGFTPDGYRDAIIANMDSLKKAFPDSICMQYVNFMPGEWLPNEDHSYMRSLFEHGKKIGVAIGAPDLMPDNPNQKNHTYKFMHELNGAILLGVAVQDGNYAGKTGEDVKPTEPWPNRVPNLAKFAKDFLKVRIIFWVAQEPYFTHDVIPYFGSTR